MFDPVIAGAIMLQFIEDPFGLVILSLLGGIAVLIQLVDVVLKFIKPEEVIFETEDE